MKIDRITRRMFLQGAGKYALAVPFAGSLSKTSEALAASAPLRFIYMGISHGSNLNMHVPDLSIGKWGIGNSSFLTTDTSLGIRSGALPSNLALAGSAFDFLMTDAVKQQLLIVNGLS